MPRNGKRERIAAGIYRDGAGLSAIARCGTVQREKRFPLGTDMRLMQRWRDDTRARLLKRRPQGPRSGFDRDARRYLGLMQHLAAYKGRKAEISAWVKRFEDRHRSIITSADVLKARVAWLEAKTSPKTINNRVQTLRHLYRTLDGPDVETPCDRVTPLPVTRTPPVVVSDATIILVEQTLAGFESVNRLPDRKTRARFRVYATCGKRPVEIMRAQPSDVSLERRVWLPRDAKGGYGPGVYLNDDALAAWTLFIEAAAWGAFNTNSFARTIRQAGWPAGVKPYNLRHTTWITASERGADLADIQADAGHKHLATTRQHYVPVLNSRMQKLGELLDGRFGWASVPLSGAMSALETGADS